MLQTFRQHTAGWMAKVLLGLLVLSFSLWGIGDMVRGYVSNQPVITVGSVKITAEMIQQTVKTYTDQLLNMAQGRLDPKALKDPRIRTQAIEQLVTKHLVAQEIEHMGLVTSDNSVRNAIQRLPELRDDQGQFDRRRYEALLSNAGRSERALIADVRERMLAQQWMMPLVSSSFLPKRLVDRLYQAQTELRDFAHVEIKRSAMKVSKVASADDLQQYYETHREKFIAPEYRSLSVIIVDPEKMKDDVKIDMAQVNAQVDQRAADFKTPETREVSVATFPTKELADQAFKQVTMGATLANSVKDLKGNLNKLGTLAKHQLPNKAIADVVFSLAAGVPSAVFVTEKGAMIFQVEKITPEKMKSKDEVRKFIIDEMKSAAVSAQMGDLRNKLEDALAGGKTIAEVAKEMDLHAHSLDMVDKDGISAKGDKVLEKIADRAQILTEAFAQVEGNDNIVDAKGGRLLAIRIDKIQPKIQLTLDQAKDKVQKAWLESQQDALAQELGHQMAQQESFADFKRLAAQHGLAVKEIRGMSRENAVEQFVKKNVVSDPVAGHALTGVQVGKSDAVPTDNGYAAIFVQAVHPKAGGRDDKAVQQFTNAMMMQRAQDIEGLLLKSTRGRYKVDRNEKMLAKLFQEGDES